MYYVSPVRRWPSKPSATRPPPPGDWPLFAVRSSALWLPPPLKAHWQQAGPSLLPAEPLPRRRGGVLVISNGVASTRAAAGADTANAADTASTATVTYKSWLSVGALRGLLSMLRRYDVRVLYHRLNLQGSDEWPGVSGGVRMAGGGARELAALFAEETATGRKRKEEEGKREGGPSSIGSDDLAMIAAEFPEVMLMHELIARHHATPGHGEAEVRGEGGRNATVRSGDTGTIGAIRRPRARYGTDVVRVLADESVRCFVTAQGGPSLLTTYMGGHAVVYREVRLNARPCLFV